MSHQHLLPWQTRLFTTVWNRLAREDLTKLSPDQIAKRRSAVIPSGLPFSLVTGARPSTVETTTIDIPMRDGSLIPARLSRPAAARSDAPVVVYYHGGGWTLGNPQSYDPLCGFLAEQVGAVVLAPDYRKAPQAKAPQATWDAYDVLTWVATRPSELNAAGPIAVAGDSAGGNLSALVCLLARDETGPEVAGQALIYPAVDLTRSHPSSHWRTEAILTGETMDVFLDAYLEGATVDARSPLVSPLWADSHEGLPPCLIQTAECDPLVDEGNHYAQVLRDAGVATRVTEYAGMPHGFMSFPGVTPVGRQARRELVSSLREWLHPAPAAPRS